MKCSNAETLLNVCVILVEPKGAANIGSVSRVMKNFGYADLRLVNPKVDHLSAESRNMAVKSADILEAARVFSSLSESLEDCELILGTTRRSGQYREEFLYPRDVAGVIAGLPAPAQTALVFGREDKGLKTAELDLCHRLVTIPTREEQPSMNLAQAAALCLYEISLSLGELHFLPKSIQERAKSSELEAMFLHMEKTLQAIGFLDPQNPKHLMHSFRRMLGRQGLDERDVCILQGLWSKVDWLRGEHQRALEKAQGSNLKDKG